MKSTKVKLLGVSIVVLGSCSWIILGFAPLPHFLVESIIAISPRTQIAPNGYLIHTGVTVGILASVIILSGLSLVFASILSQARHQRSRTDQ